MTGSSTSYLVDQRLTATDVPAASDSKKLTPSKERYQMLSVRDAPLLFNAQRQQQMRALIVATVYAPPQTGRGEAVCRIDADRQMRPRQSSATGDDSRCRSRHQGSSGRLNLTDAAVRDPLQSSAIRYPISTP